MVESAGARIRLIINHSPDAERIDVAERADVTALWFPLFLVILPPQIILEAVRGGVSAVVGRQIGRIAAGNGRLVARPYGGTSRDRVVGSFENLDRQSGWGSAIVRGSRSIVSLQTL